MAVFQGLQLCQFLGKQQIEDLSDGHFLCTRLSQGLRVKQNASSAQQELLLCNSDYKTRALLRPCQVGAKQSASQTRQQASKSKQKQKRAKARTQKQANKQKQARKGKQAKASKGKQARPNPTQPNPTHPAHPTASISLRQPVPTQPKPSSPMKQPS